MLKRSSLAGLCAVLVVFATPVAGLAQAVSDDAKAAARELMVAMRAADNFEKMMPTIVEAIKPAIVQGRPEVARDYPAIAKFVMRSVVGQSHAMIEAVSLIYARHFTAEELRQITVFMRGQVGQKFVEKLPLISHESMLIGQRLGQAVALQMREKIVDELRKRGHKI